MRILVIGAGSIGRRHAENLTTLGAVATLLPWRETSATDVERRLSRGDAEAVVIATATDIRLPLIQACASADVPFYCEKPVAFRLAELEAIAMTAAPLASRSMAGYMMRYHAGFRALAALDLHDAHRFSLTIGHDVTQWRANWRFSASYAARAEGGGVLLDLCHEVDMAACLFPDLQLVSCDSTGHAAYPGVDMASVLNLRRRSTTGTVAMDYLCPRLVRRCLIDTPGLSADFDFAAGSYRIATAKGIDTPSLQQDRNDMFLDAMRDFLALVEGKAPPSANPFVPRFDRTLSASALIARAWEARVFRGLTAKDIP